MNKVDFDKHVDAFRNEIHRVVQTNFEESGSIEPVVFALVKPDEQEPGIAVLAGLEPFFTSEAGKATAAGIIRASMEKLKPLAIAFASEAWCVEGSKEQMDDYEKLIKGEVKPAQHPAKKEILFITTETHEKESMRSWYIQRSECGENPVLVDQHLNKKKTWNDKEGSGYRGKLTNFLQESYTDIVE